MKDVVIYRGEAIAKGSDAFKLWEAKKWKELDAHLKTVQDAARKRGEIL